MYRDFALGPDLFHWESQNATSTTSPAGQRYLHHRERGSHVVLFVREQRADDIGEGAPFLCLGRLRLRRARGREAGRDHVEAAAPDAR